MSRSDLRLSSIAIVPAFNPSNLEACWRRRESFYAGPSAAGPQCGKFLWRGRPMDLRGAQPRHARLFWRVTGLTVTHTHTTRSCESTPTRRRCASSSSAILTNVRIWRSRRVLTSNPDKPVRLGETERARSTRCRLFGMWANGRPRIAHPRNLDLTSPLA